MGRSTWIATIVAIALAATTAPAQTPDSARRLDSTRVATESARLAARPTARGDTAATAAAVAARQAARGRGDTAAAAAATPQAVPRASGATGWALGGTIICLLVYFFGIVLSRWHHIGRSVHEMLARQLAALETRIATEMGPHHDCREVQALRDRVAQLKAVSEAARRYNYLATGAGFAEFLFWSRGRENAMWVEIHEIERQLASYLSPIEQVNVYLVWAEAELTGVERKGAREIADRIANAMATPLATFDAERATQERTRKALLGRALSIIYESRDTAFSTLMEWQNKASWLTFAALLIIGFLAAAAGNPLLFLAGAAGGYLSRLMRALKREDVPLDYGASWTTLFLSPLLGALAGWFGIALITIVANPDLNLLGPAFAQVRWEPPLAVSTIALAFLFGFSERFFDAVVGAVERHAERTEEARRVPVDRATPVVPDVDARRLPTRDDGAATGGVTAPGGLPFITSTERRGVTTNETKETLVVRGMGFVPQSKVRVNGRERDAEVRSATELVLALEPADVSTIENGDFVIAVVNPGGTASAERHVFETV